MTIKTRISGGPPIAVTTSDTLIIQPTDRIAVSSLSLFNTSGGTVVVTIYESPDLTSASGTVVGSRSISMGSPADNIIEVEGQGYTAGQNIIMVADVAGVNARFSFTQYSGDSV